MSNEYEIGSFRTRKGNQCIVTSTKVLWFHADGSTYQVPIQDIQSVTIERKGHFLNSGYVVNIFKKGITNPEWTEFSSENDQRGMASAIQTAIRNYKK